MNFSQPVPMLVESKEREHLFTWMQPAESPRYPVGMVQMGELIRIAWNFKVDMALIVKRLKAIILSDVQNPT